MHNRTADGRTEFTPDHLRVLSDFCAAAQYPTFNRERWIDYIAGANRYEGSPKRGPRLTANKGQREVFLSLLWQFRTDAGLRHKDVAKALGSPRHLSASMRPAPGDWICQALGIPLGGFVRNFEKTLLDPNFHPDDSLVKAGHIVTTEAENA